MVRTTVGEILGYDGNGLIERQPLVDAIIAQHYVLKANNGSIIADKIYDIHRIGQLLILPAPDGNIYRTSDAFFRICDTSKENKPNNGGPTVDYELNKIRKSMKKYYRKHSQN